jgi:hypothetical protein
MKNNTRGIVVTETLLLAMYVAGMFAVGGHKWYLEHQADKLAGEGGRIIRIGIDYSGATTSVCEERATFNGRNPDR